MSFKTFLRNTIPPPLLAIPQKWRSYSEDEKAWLISSKAWKSTRRMEKIRSVGPQKSRCFILGNGPSLRNTDLSFLQNEVTFGMNRIYLLFDQLGFSTTYYVSINQLVIEQCSKEIENLKCPKFLNWKCRDHIQFTSDTMFLISRNGPAFFHDITEGIWEGATVTYAALQIAFYLGYKEVILVGIDHSFATKGKPNTTVISQGDDPDHFSSNYFGKGFKWQLPDLETSELAYRIAKYEYEINNRVILDATIGGRLEIFRKVKYESLFS